MAQKRSSPAKEKKGKFHIEMSSLSLFFWGFCLCFLLAWVFVLGVLVGRGFLPSAVSTSDLKAQVSRLQGLVLHSKSPSQDTPRVESDPKLAFYEKLSSKKEEVKKKVPREEKPARPETTPAKAPAERKAETPSTPPKSAEKGPNDTRHNQFTVQLASLEDKAKAEGMVSRLKGSGYDAYYSEVKIKEKIFYRIRCGKFKTREEAGIQAKRLADQAGIHGFVSKVE